MRRLVALDDPAQVRATEEREHRQIRFAVAAVRGRVDEDDTARRPQHVAVPQVSVQTRGRIFVVEGSRGDEIAGGLDVVALTVGDAARLDRDAQEGQHPLCDVERSPGVVHGAAHGAAADEQLPVVIVGCRTETGGAHVVHPGECGTELPCGLDGRGCLGDPLEFDVVLAHRPHRRHRHTGLGEPGQTGRLGPEEIRMRVRVVFAEDVSGAHPEESARPHSSPRPLRPTLFAVVSQQ